MLIFMQNCNVRLLSVFEGFRFTMGIVDSQSITWINELVSITWTLWIESNRVGALEGRSDKKVEVFWVRLE